MLKLHKPVPWWIFEISNATPLIFLLSFSQHRRARTEEESFHFRLMEKQSESTEHSHSYYLPIAFSLSMWTQFPMGLFIPTFGGKWLFWLCGVSLLYALSTHTFARHQVIYLLWSLFKPKTTNMMSRWEVLFLSYFCIISDLNANSHSKCFSGEVRGIKQNIYSILLTIPKSNMIEWYMPVVKSHKYALDEWPLQEVT